MSDQQKLRYHMVYLPGSVEGCFPVKDGIVATDGSDLWHSKLTRDSEGQPVVENSMTGIKGVCAMDLVPDSDFILVVTVSTVIILLHLIGPTGNLLECPYSLAIFTHKACKFWVGNRLTVSLANFRLSLF
jgi:hypothetical protein